MLKNNTFWNQFLLEFSSLWPPKMEGKFVVFWIFIEKADFVKIIVFPWENCYFSGFEPSKMNQISMFFFDNYIGKNGSNIEFWTTSWCPETFQIDSKSDVERSLLGDAMQLTRKSSQTNGPCDFWTAKLALHMIRST